MLRKKTDLSAVSNSQQEPLSGQLISAVTTNKKMAEVCYGKL